ncbi:MAG: hypothetical protein HYU68_03980 [Bacteroidetes bacterium]|nr:hypothetical protein [Bacteroidota bacterium]
MSLYSRSSLQEQIKDNEFKFGYLSNGEKIVLFKRDNLTNFFNQIKDLFKERQEKDEITSVDTVNEPIIEYSSNKLLEITDKTLLQELKPLLRKNQVLQAVEITSNYFDGKFKDMTFKDWYQLVNQLYKKMNSK